MENLTALLHRVPLFKGAEKENIDRLLAAGEVRALPRGNRFPAGQNALAC